MPQVLAISDRPYECFCFGFYMVNSLHKFSVGVISDRQLLHKELLRRTAPSTSRELYYDNLLRNKNSHRNAVAVFTFYIILIASPSVSENTNARSGDFPNSSRTARA